MSIFNNIIYLRKCSMEQRTIMLMRPAIFSSDSLIYKVSDIIDNVKREGDFALNKYSDNFDQTQINTLRVPSAQINSVGVTIGESVKQAMEISVYNINHFHNKQNIPIVDLETQPGVRCQQITRPIESVGLYIPSGSAPLFSTVLMLAIPAKISGCSYVVLCSPPPISDEILYASQLCDVKEVYQVGGAQAIGALCFGTESIPRVDKIFGPGNVFVTEAKRQVSKILDGAAIDMPAGPSEVIVIADNDSIPNFIASDLLAQSEHGSDSQVILLTPEPNIAYAVANAIEQQLEKLPRSDTIRKSLLNNRLIITRSLKECVEISNKYGPEHLIIQASHARDFLSDITSAGSIFLGNWSPESAGDYASGTNHVLPTYGYTANSSSLGIAEFQKKMTVQEISPQGLMNLAATIETLAISEQLIAHKNAITLRVSSFKEQA